MSLSSMAASLVACACATPAVISSRPSSDSTWTAAFALLCRRLGAKVRVSEISPQMVANMAAFLESRWKEAMDRIQVV